jgi:hypothetical protein
MDEKRFRAPGPGQNGQDMGHTRQTNAQADARVCFYAECDRTLATMTHMLASSSQSTKKNSEGRVRSADFELVSMICVSEQRKLNNTNQG